METCKANKCKKNSQLKSHNKWNDFERCSKPVFKDGFCKRCFNKDKRFKNINWIPDQLWKRDGIYGEPYDFPTHKKEQERLWVEMIYTLHPEIKPQNDEDESQEVLEVSEEIKEEKITRKGQKKNVSPTEELVKLSNLFKEKLLTEEEFKKAKAMVLNL